MDILFDIIIRRTKGTRFWWAAYSLMITIAIAMNLLQICTWLQN